MKLESVKDIYDSIQKNGGRTPETRDIRTVDEVILKNLCRNNPSRVVFLPNPFGGRILAPEMTRVYLESNGFELEIGGTSSGKYWMISGWAKENLEVTK